MSLTPFFRSSRCQLLRPKDNAIGKLSLTLLISLRKFFLMILLTPSFRFFRCQLLRSNDNAIRILSLTLPNKKYSKTNKTSLTPSFRSSRCQLLRSKDSAIWKWSLTLLIIGELSLKLLSSLLRLRSGILWYAFEDLVKKIELEVDTKRRTSCCSYIFYFWREVNLDWTKCVWTHGACEVSPFFWRILQIYICERIFISASVSRWRLSVVIRFNIT